MRLYGATRQSTNWCVRAISRFRGQEIQAAFFARGARHWEGGKRLQTPTYRAAGPPSTASSSAGPALLLAADFAVSRLHTGQAIGALALRTKRRVDQTSLRACSLVANAMGWGLKVMLTGCVWCQIPCRAAIFLKGDLLTFVSGIDLHVGPV